MWCAAICVSIISWRVLFADKLDPMIIDGSVNHHLWRHNLGDAHHSNVVKVFGTTFKSMFAYEDVEGAIEENINIATQNGKKMTPIVFEKSHQQKLLSVEK